MYKRQLFTLVGVVAIFTCWLILHGFRRTARVAVLVGVLIVAAYVAGSFSTDTLSTRELYGENAVALDNRGYVPMHNGAW